ncbi:MAG TPA: GH92 family glycosyl hydrolase [Solirubrobacteraceae bacterium]|nr:GH92 family glycosyl hydrolase [Solirubrobacteraceae bacterium]
MRLASVLVLAVGALALGGLAPRTAAAQDVTQYVDPMTGTIPVGFVFPGAATPFGMVQNSPDTTSPIAYTGYVYTDPIIRGFSLLHLSGGGAPMSADLPFMPSVSPAPSNSDPNAMGSGYDHSTEHAEPGYYTVALTQGTKVELTAGAHTAMQRYTFPPTPSAGVILDVSRNAEGVRQGTFAVTGPDEVSGSVNEGHYRAFFVARFSRPFSSTKTFAASGTGAGGWVGFDTTADQAVTVRVGVSFVDLTGARNNLHSEAPTFDFDGMRAAAHAAWAGELGRVQTQGATPLELKSFYTALYHASLYPSVFNDVDGRYMGFDQQIHHIDGGHPQYANFSSWDTYRAENQLLALWQPTRYRDMLRSLLRDHQQGGYLPRWGEYSYDASHMSGDPAIQMIVDGYCRGLLNRQEAAALYAAGYALRARRSADLYRLGYLPGNAGTTLEYGVADFDLALMADALGRRGDVARLVADSLRYRNLLEPASKWIAPRNGDGSWPSPFDPTSETGFQEGNSWQYSWLVMHDERGLFDRMGGDAAVAGRLQNFFREPPEAQNAQNVFGTTYRTDQFAPGNEMDLEAPWLFPWLRQPSATAAETRSLQRLWRPTPDGMPGNDDLGSMSAWHVFNMLGFSPVAPGAPFYVIGSPAFTNVVITPTAGAPITIEAPGASAVNQYVTAASIAGQPLRRAWFEDALLRGRTLVLTTASQPDASWATEARSVPPSVSDASLAAFGCQPSSSAASDPAPQSRIESRGYTVTYGSGQRGPAFAATNALGLGGSRVGRPHRLHLSIHVWHHGRRGWVRVRVMAGARAVRGAMVSIGARHARTGRSGLAVLRVRRAGRYRLRASKAGMLASSTMVTVR